MEDATITEFNDETRALHVYLTADDDCYYFVEFIKGAGYGPPGNSFINNLKKQPSKRNTWEWPHKVRAIRTASRTLLRELPPDWLSDSTFVPVPPSKARGHAEYDDRMLQVLRGLGNADVRELVIQTESMEATHVSDQRHTINELVANYEIDEDQAEPEPTHLVIVDDMMTAGAHFRAMARVLGERFPAVPISGVFLARRIFPENNG
jgi:hypothetical protein